jgi:hypothetical protein
MKGLLLLLALMAPADKEPPKVIKIVGFEDVESAEPKKPEESAGFKIELKKCIVSTTSTDAQVNVSGFLARANTVLTCKGFSEDDKEFYTRTGIRCEPGLDHHYGSTIRDYSYFERDSAYLFDGGYNLNSMIVLDSKTKVALVLERSIQIGSTISATINVCEGVYSEVK